MIWTILSSAASQCPGPKPWKWVPAGLLTQLVPLVRGGSFVQIEYPDATGATAAGTFAVEIGSQKIFKFVDSVPMWYNVELTATAQEVV